MKAIVIGTSQGGAQALDKILSGLPVNFPMPIVVVLHRLANGKEFLENQLNNRCELNVKQAEDKEDIEPGTVYFAPPGYHLLMEDDETFSLSVDERVKYSRPSIDVLFESAADVYGKELIAILLTGANSDGAEGLKIIKSSGGVAIVQDPKQAEAAQMPNAALKLLKPDLLGSLSEISSYLKEYNNGKT